MAKNWEERIEGYHAYYNEDDRKQTYGDVRVYTSCSLDDPPICSSSFYALVYTPLPHGMNLGQYPDLASAKIAVEKECTRQSF
jgi:hypothetical protein